MGAGSTWPKDCNQRGVFPSDSPEWSDGVGVELEGEC